MNLLRKIFVFLEKLLFLDHPPSEEKLIIVSKGNDAPDMYEIIQN